MALKKRYLLSGVVAVLAFSSLARAQTVQPFIDPGYFDYDMQLFAPADELDAYGGDPVQKYGWFGSYDRMYISVSRPKASQFVASNNMGADPILYMPPNPGGNPPTQVIIFGVGGVVTPNYNLVSETTFDLGDKTWGNRVDLGYMTEENDGWLFSYMHIDGPNAAQVQHLQRANRINTQDNGSSPATVGGQQNNNQLTIVEPSSDRNDAGPPNRERFYDIRNSLNEAKLTSLELNKVFRMPPLNHGGILEPFVGIRYMNFQDYTLRQNYDNTTQTYTTDNLPRTIDQGSTIINNPNGSQTVIPNPPLIIAAAAGLTPAEALLSERYQFDNRMIGGQLGLRWGRRLSRWNLSSDFRGFACENFQHLHHAYDRVYTMYAQGGTATGGSTSNTLVTKIDERTTTNDWNTTQAVVGTDIRVSAAYDVTRDVQLDVGVQFLGFFNGIGRGSNLAYNNGDVMMTGVAFGFVWNR